MRARASRRLEGQRQQGQDPAFALIVGAHDQQHVFDGDNHDQRPHDQRQDAEYVFRPERQPVLGVEALPESIDRARPDVAEHDAERRDGEPGETGRRPRPSLLLVGGRRGVPGRDDFGRSCGITGTLGHAILLPAAVERAAAVLEKSDAV